MSDYLLVSHGLRINIDNDFDKSHFIVPENFNLITFHTPGEKLFNKLGFIIQEYLPTYYKNITDTFILHIKERREKLNLIENQMIIEYIYKKLEYVNNEEDSREESNIYGLEPINKLEVIVFDYIFDNTEDVNNLTQSKKLINDNIDKIKKNLNFQIRVYPNKSQAPKMDFQFEGGTGGFMGLFNINSLPENLFNMDKHIAEHDEKGIPQKVELLDLSINKSFKLSDFYTEEDILKILQDNNQTGNLFIFSCGSYNKELPKIIRQKSSELQGFKYKYLKYKGKYIKLKKYISTINISNSWI